MALFCPSQVNGGIEQQLDKEVLHYDYHASFFDIFVSQVKFVSVISCIVFFKMKDANSLFLCVHIQLKLLAVFRFAALILAYAVCKLRHWWAIAVCIVFLSQKSNPPNTSFFVSH